MGSFGNFYFFEGFEPRMDTNEHEFEKIQLEQTEGTARGDRRKFIFYTWIWSNSVGFAWRVRPADLNAGTRFG
jgi:hypothetical protein